MAKIGTTEEIGMTVAMLQIFLLIPIFYPSRVELWFLIQKRLHCL